MISNLIKTVDHAQGEYAILKVLGHTEETVKIKGVMVKFMWKAIFSLTWGVGAAVLASPAISNRLKHFCSQLWSLGSHNTVRFSP